MIFFRSQPSSYRATTQDVDYLENQCAREKRPGNCEYDEYSGQDLGFADIQMTTRSQELCGEQCDQTSAFNCRSYSYFPSTGVSREKPFQSIRAKIFQVCRLSGDDTVSASPAAVTERAGALYYQRAPCVDRESNLSTLEPSPRAEAQGPVDLVRQGPKSRTEVQSPRQPPPTAQHRVRREDGSGEGGTQTYNQNPSLAFFLKPGHPMCHSSFSTRSVFLLFLSSFLNPLLSPAPPFLGWV